MLYFFIGGNKMSKREEKIQINLAKICKSEFDTFSYIKTQYLIDYTCELCGQQHISKVCWVKNNQTDLVIKVGSDCIEHFNLPKSDIDKAEAILKRIEHSINSGRKLLVEKYGKKLYAALPEPEQKKGYTSKPKQIEALGVEYLKTIPKAEKTALFVNAYMMWEAIQLFDDDGRTKLSSYIYSSEEISEFVKSGIDAAEKIDMKEYYDEKIASAKAYKKNNEMCLLRNTIQRSRLNLTKEGWLPFNESDIISWKKRASELNMEEEVDRIIGLYEKERIGHSHG